MLLSRNLLTIILLAFALPLFSQPVTGVWKGRIRGKKVELKLVKNGDSLTGTSYYFDSPSAYRRYAVKGYFDAGDNSLVWWDDRLIEEKGLRLSSNSPASLSIADFNCPGGDEMYLNGQGKPKQDPEGKGSTVSLTKTGNPQFPDEWDYVIENYTVGGNDPELIDSIGLIATSNRIVTPTVVERPVIERPINKPTGRGMVHIPPKPEKKTPDPVITAKVDPPAPPPITIEEKFRSRKRMLHSEIPVEGDSVELRFYDNAEIDGDSISLFLDNRLLFTHVRLTDKAYTIKVAVADIADSSDLTMVAENLGSIPPNTSYMVAMVNGKRYEAKLASTENSSAVIRLRKVKRATP